MQELPIPVQPIAAEYLGRWRGKGGVLSLLYDFPPSRCAVHEPMKFMEM